MADSQYILVYDANCGPCSKFKHAVDWFDRYNRLRYLSLEDADVDGLLNPLPVLKRHTSFHLISPKGTIRSGSEAVPDLIALLPSGPFFSFFLRSMPLGKNAVRFVYSTLSRLHDSGSCSYEAKSGTVSPPPGNSKLESNDIFLGKKKNRISERQIFRM